MTEQDSAVHPRGSPMEMLSELKVAVLKHTPT